MELSLPSNFLWTLAALSWPYITHSGTIATVRQEAGICPQEQAYVQARTERVRNALEHILGQQLTDAQVPRIAVCASGGGCRAALATLGWMQGMELIPQKKGYLESIMAKWDGTTLGHYINTVIASWLGLQDPTPPTPNNNVVEPSPLSLLDATTYVCGLSGSTWAISGLQYSRMSPTHYLETITKQLTKPLLAHLSVQAIAQNLIKKHDYYEQPISIIDVYGSILANKFLHCLGAPDVNDVDMSSYTTLCDTAQSPFPIHSAILDNQGSYEWVEFTPYEVGSTFLNAFIPTWAFGRKCNAGSSIDDAPAQSLGYGMGIWGSVLSVNAKEFFNLIVEPNLQSITSEFLTSQFGSITAQAAPHLTTIYNDIQNSQSPLLKDRISPAKVFNWSKGMTGCPYTKSKTITLLDAGIDTNVAVPPALRPERAVDIIIILDATRGMLKENLTLLQNYVAKHALHMPDVDFTKINQICSVHQNSADPMAPIVIYIPLILIPAFDANLDPQTIDFCNTFNFQYTEDQINQLTGLAKYSMQQSQDIIIDVIKQWIANHS